MFLGLGRNLGAKFLIIFLGIVSSLTAITVNFFRKIIFYRKLYLYDLVSTATGKVFSIVLMSASSEPCVFH